MMASLTTASTKIFMTPQLSSYMFCTCTATSVAMVIYAHSPQPNEPPCRDSYQDLLETKKSAKESLFTAAPRTSIVIKYITLQMPWSQSCASWVLKRQGLVIINQSTSPYCFLPLCCGAFQCRCTMTSFSNPIKGGVHLNLGHFLLVSHCTSIIGNSEHISPGKGAFLR